MPRVHVRFDEFLNTGPVPPIELVAPRGALVIFGLAWPKTIGGYRCTVVPQSTNYMLSTILEPDGRPEHIENLLNKLEPPPLLEVSDIPSGTHNGSLIKSHRVTQATGDSEILNCLMLEEEIIQQVQILDTVRSIEFTRLGNVIRLPCDNIPNDTRFVLACEWREDGLVISTTWVDRGSGEVRVEKSELKLAASTTEKLSEAHAKLGPPELIRGGGDLDPDAVDTPRVAYADLEDLYRTLHSVICDIATTISQKASPSAFWDQQPEVQPKHEVPCGHTLRLLLEQGLRAKRVRIMQEASGRSGNVDFCFIGVIADGHQLESICFEVKRAQSGKLKDGLTVQLPIYMTEQESSAGIYGVFWFKGEHCDVPTAHDTPHALATMLSEHMPPGVRSVIAVSRQAQ